nr:IS630 family transposase [Fluoribacter gormanii]
MRYSGRGLRDLLKRLGFSSQKPIKQAYQRDPDKVSQWLNETYPAIKTRAMREGSRIYCADEMGLQSCDNRGRTYGLVNQTPVIKKTGSRFKVNMLATINPQGFMNWMVFENNCDSKKFIEFLGRLRRQVKQKVVLIVDNHRMHYSRKVMHYIEKFKNEIEIFLPPYSPQLNLQVLVNQDVKANACLFKPVRCVSDLLINIRLYLTKIQFNEFKIMNFFKKNETKYAAWE